MNRHEFLKRLEDALEGEVSPQVVHSNLQYYENYILTEVSKGRPEQDVMEELGDPRLIARTIFDSQEAAEGTYGSENYTYEEPEDRRGDDTRYAYDSEEENTGSTGLTELWQKIRPTVIIAAVIIVVLAVLSLLFSMTLHILMSPIFWILLAVFGIWNAFFR